MLLTTVKKIAADVSSTQSYKKTKKQRNTLITCLKHFSLNYGKFTCNLFEDMCP